MWAAHKLESPLSENKKIKTVTSSPIRDIDGAGTIKFGSANTGQGRMSLRNIYYSRIFNKIHMFIYTSMVGFGMWVSFPPKSAYHASDSSLSMESSVYYRQSFCLAGFPPPQMIEEMLWHIARRTIVHRWLVGHTRLMSNRIENLKLPFMTQENHSYNKNDGWVWWIWNL